MFVHISLTGIINRRSVGIRSRTLVKAGVMSYGDNAPDIARCPLALRVSSRECAFVSGDTHEGWRAGPADSSKNQKVVGGIVNDLSNIRTGRRYWARKRRGVVKYRSINQVLWVRLTADAYIASIES